MNYNFEYYGKINNKTTPIVFDKFSQSQKMFKGRFRILHFEFDMGV